MHTTPAYCLCAAALICPAGQAELSAATSGRTEERATQPATPQSNVRDLLNKIGLTPEAACASGVTSSDVSLVFQAGADVLTTSGDAIRASELAVQTSRATLEAMTKRSSEQSEPAAADLQQAHLALESALQAQSAAYASAFQAVCAALPESTRAVLSTVRQNAGRTVPSQLKVVARTASEWSALEKAIAHAKARTRAGLCADQSGQELMATAEADATVVAAKARLESSLAAVQAAWGAATE